MPATHARPRFLPLATALTALAWASLWLWGSGPYGRYLDHGDWLRAGSAAVLCRAFPGGERLMSPALYVGGWLLMTAAMMLPTVLPLLDRFDRILHGRPERRRLIALVIAGYLIVWLGFGAFAHLSDEALHRAAQHSAWLSFNGWVIGSAIFAVAGLFQFSRLKYHCLSRCRTPFGFIAKHWHGPNPFRSALALGLDHGVFCVGCCWAIMLLMFVIGSGSVGWMLLLGVVMAAEKNMPWGARLGRPLGAALLAGAAAIAVVNLEL
jgi:predicted metal-binding membrane protein